MAGYLSCCVVVVLLCALPVEAMDRSRSIVIVKPAKLTVAVLGECAPRGKALDTMQAEATRVWSRAGVNVAWVQASELPHRAPKSAWMAVQCTPGPLTGTPAEGQRVMAIAGIRFVDSEPSNIITVSLANANALLEQESGEDRILSDRFHIARQLKLGRMLGRAVAHEIGHFLSQSREHTARGLMRPTHTVAALTGPSLAPFTIEAAAIPLQY